MGNADGEVNNFISSLMQAEWPSQQQERKKQTQMNEAKIKSQRKKKKYVPK